MTVILVAVAITWLCTAIVSGFSWITVASLISSLMFSGRKIGYFCKLTHLLVIEGIGFFLTYVMESVFNKVVDWKQLALLFIIRTVFILISWYDITQIVYTKEERRKDSSEV